MTSFWIVHRDSRSRAALARLAGAGDDSVLGAPTDAHFDSLEMPDLVLMGLSGDLEQELEFAHRFAARLAGAHWFLFCEPSDREEVSRLFDTLSAEVLSYPPQPEHLRERVRVAAARRRHDSLSERQVRDAVASRFSRYFAGLEMPELLRSVNPRLGDVPLLIRGEVGTGRSLLARYIHAFGGTTGGAFRALDCEGAFDLATLQRAIERTAEDDRARSALTLCFEEVDRLRPSLQRELSHWVGLAPPPAALRSPRLRFMATAGDPDAGDPDRRLDPQLGAAFSGLSIRVPPLRRRPDAVEAFARATFDAWFRERGERTRSLDPEALALLVDYPWPGNLRELEGVLIRTLAASSAEPIRPEHLRFESMPPEPIPEPTSRPLPATLAQEAEEILAEVVALPETEDLDAAAATEAEALEEASVSELAPEDETLEEASVSEPAPEDDESPEQSTAPEPRLEPEPAVPPADVAPQTTPATASELRAALQRLAVAVAHEVRNPLVAIRTFAQLLPERFQDEDFRTRFAESVQKDVRRLEEVTTRLSQLGDLVPGERLAVDVARILDELLEARREALQERRVLVLKELDRSQPFGVGDPAQLRVALDCLLDKALSLVPERGDAYVASRHHPSGLRGEPAMRILVRFQGPPVDRDDAARGLTLAAASLDLIVAEALVRAQGGSFHLDASDAGETIVVIDLPAPP